MSKMPDDELATAAEKLKEVYEAEVVDKKSAKTHIAEAVEHLRFFACEESAKKKKIKGRQKVIAERRVCLETAVFYNSNPLDVISLLSDSTAVLVMEPLNTPGGLDLPFIGTTYYGSPGRHRYDAVQILNVGSKKFAELSKSDDTFQVDLAVALLSKLKSFEQQVGKLLGHPLNTVTITSYSYTSKDRYETEIDIPTSSSWTIQDQAVAFQSYMQLKNPQGPWGYASQQDDND